MTISTKTPIAIDLINEYSKKECLFVFEKYLNKLPWDWIDAITFLYSNGIDQNQSNFCIVFDDKQTADLFKFLEKKWITLYVISEKKIKGKTVIWNLRVEPEKVEGENDLKTLFIGGDNLRKYCDKYNLYYKTAYTKDGKLISGSSLKFLKKEKENCRKPLNKKPIKENINDARA